MYNSSLQIQRTLLFLHISLIIEIRHVAISLITHELNGIFSPPHHICLIFFFFNRQHTFVVGELRKIYLIAQKQHVGQVILIKFLRNPESAHALFMLPFLCIIIYQVFFFFLLILQEKTSFLQKKNDIFYIYIYLTSLQHAHACPHLECAGFTRSSKTPTPASSLVECIN